MRKKLNFVLIIGSVIALVLAVKYSALPIFSFFPNKIAEFWITSEKE